MMTRNDTDDDLQIVSEFVNNCIGKLTDNPPSDGVLYVGVCFD